MNKSVIAAITASIALSISACSTATQTGGGTSEDTSASTDNPVSFEPVPETVEPLTIAEIKKSGKLAGTASPKFGTSNKGQFDVVASGPVNSQVGTSRVPVVVRNSTSEPMTDITVTGAAKDGTGKIIGSGNSQGIRPKVVPPGGIALGYVFYMNEIPADAKIDFTVASEPVEGEPYFRDLKMNQANLTGTSVAGQATNTSDDTLNGPYSVTVYCLDGNKLLSAHPGFASPDAKLAPNQSVTFDVPLFDATCPTFLTGVSGYGPLG